MSDNFLASLRAANIERNKEWRPSSGDPLSSSFRIAEIVAELGELASEVKRLQRHQLGMSGGSLLTGNLPKEVADVLISLDALAMDFHIDLESVTIQKFNETSLKYGLKTMLSSGENSTCSGEENHE